MAEMIYSIEELLSRLGPTRCNVEVKYDEKHKKLFVEGRVSQFYDFQIIQSYIASIVPKFVVVSYDIVCRYCNADGHIRS